MNILENEWIIKYIPLQQGLRLSKSLDKRVRNEYY